MIVVDEYLAVRVMGGWWPDGLPDDDDLALPASRHWRLLQRVHSPSGGQLSQILALAELAAVLDELRREVATVESEYEASYGQMPTAGH